MKKYQENTSEDKNIVYRLSYPYVFASPRVGTKLRTLIVLVNIPGLSCIPSTIFWGFDWLLFFFLFDSGEKNEHFS